MRLRRLLSTVLEDAFDRWMEELREQDDLLDQRYAEELYLNRRKGLIPPAEKVSSQDKEPKQVTPPQGT